MRSNKWKEKEYSTETLTQIEVDEIMAESQGYEEGRAPVSRHTQYAQDLEDLAELQRSNYKRDEFNETHNYKILDAVREYSPRDYEEGEFDESAYDAYDTDRDTEFSLQPLNPADESYDDIMENFEEVMEKMSANPTKPKYWFKEQGDHWFCSCGQLNKGDYCTNCGLERELLRSLFFLHEPSGEPGKFEGMDINYTDVDMSKGMSSKFKLIIAIIIILILLAGTGIFSYFYVIKPNMEKEAAAKQGAAAESLKTNVVMCTSEMDSFVRNSYITAGDSCLKNEDYDQAIRFYGMAQSIKDTDDIKAKINDAKYAYVIAHKSEGGEKFEKYLNELYKANYSNIAEIYDEYYAWHVKIVANLSPDDYSSDISSASRSDIVYFHVSLSGGPPGETLDVYYKAKYPSGHEEIQQIGTGWKAGSKGSARCMYAVPLLGKEGKLTFNVLNKSTEEIIGSDSITFSK